MPITVTYRVDDYSPDAVAYREISPAPHIAGCLGNKWVESSDEGDVIRAGYCCAQEIPVAGCGSYPVWWSDSWLEPEPEVAEPVPCEAMDETPASFEVPPEPEKTHIDDTPDGVPRDEAQGPV